MRGAAAALALVAACGGGDTGTAADATPPDAAGPRYAAWDRELPPAAVMGVRRGLTPARGIIHLHSPYSFDACDGQPRDRQSKAVDESCLADLRAGLCATRMDYAALTDHDDSMADEEFADLFVRRGDDVLVTNPAGDPVASRLRCPDGHEVLLTVGGENNVMALMLDRHPDGTVQQRHDIYNAENAATMDLFRQLGGLAWIAHTEQRPIELLRELGPDGVEVYQLHANIDPDIRAEYLGLDGPGAIKAVVKFADQDPAGPEPDLALLSFLEPNNVSIDRWDLLLGEGRRVTGSGGSDAHENALPILLRDGERGDSYRRILRWFDNVVLVDDPSDPAAIEAALAGGRMFIAFELFGTPVGFDAVAEGPGGAAPVELGGEVGASAGATLTVTLPAVNDLDPRLPAPAIRARILRLDAAGRTEVAAGAGPTVSAPLDAPGAYRVEVLITPLHLGPYLGNLGPAYAEREQVWIYGNPIYVLP